MPDVLYRHRRYGVETSDEEKRHEIPASSIIGDIQAFFQNRTLTLTAVSSGLSAFVGYAMLSWNPSMLERAKGMSLGEAAFWYGIVVGTTGVLGTFGSGWLVDRLAARDRRWYAWLPATSFALTLPALAGVVLAPDWRIALIFLTVPSLLNNAYLAPALTVVQNEAHPARRAIAGATLLLVLNLVGLGCGPVYVGRLSDVMKTSYGAHSLLVGYAALAPVIVLMIIAHLFVAASIRRESGV